MTFKNELQKQIEGDVKDDLISLKIYSTDASFFEVSPLLIVLPKSEEDLIKTIHFAKAHNLSITARGAATSLTGAPLGKGIIIDFSRYMNQIIEINSHEGYAICQPGVIQDELTRQAKPFGLRLGPNTSTGNRATLGGMIGNNSAGSHSLRYGSMAEAVMEIDLITSQAEKLHLSNERKLDFLISIKQKYEAAISKNFPKILRRASGYSLDRLEKAASFIASSEGTLGLISKVKVKLEKLPVFSALFVLHFDSLNKAFDTINELLYFNPYALEIIDEHIIEMGKISSYHKEDLSFLKGFPKAIVMIEFDNENQMQAFQKIYQIEPEKNPENVWKLRKAGLGLLLSRRTHSRAICLFEDIAVVPKELPQLMQEIDSILKKFQKDAGIYGHLGAGCIHIKPFIDFRNEKHVLNELLDEVSSLIKRYKGALSGEHGDGLLRSYLNKKIFGDELYQAFLDIKKTFDPIGLFNPGKIVEASVPFDLIRKPPKDNYQTFLNFNDNGGFELSVDLCNGNGLCRKKDSIMCPTFQATNDEFFSTRARANALRGMITGDIPSESEQLFEILDYCIECKGCKKECPSLVDMAKMKSEFLFHYHKHHGLPLRDRLFGNIGKIQFLMSKLPYLSNKLIKISKPILKKIGIDPRRTLPTINRPFKPKKIDNPDIVLFIDTFTYFNTPSIASSAYELLTRLGLKVFVPKWSCCGRPYISKGMLKEAKEALNNLVSNLKPYAHLPIVMLEPSCLSVLKDDIHYFDMALKGVSIDEFLSDFFKNKQISFKSINENIALHTHCHQKTLLGSKITLELLKKLPGATIYEIDAGCCGMAGSFGYESNHYDLSMKIAYSKLVPSIESLPKNTTIIANGTSCRSQINHILNKKPKHLVEVLLERLID